MSEYKTVLGESGRIHAMRIATAEGDPLYNMNSSDNASSLLCGDAAELLCPLQLGALLPNSSNKNVLAIDLEVNHSNHTAIEAGTPLTGTVGIKHVSADDGDKNGMAESDEQDAVMSFQLILEGSENTVVMVQDGEDSHPMYGKHTFLHKAYDLKSASNTKYIENGGNFPFSIHLPEDMPTSMHRYVWDGGFQLGDRGGDCRISYQVTATIIVQGSEEARLFKSLSIPLKISAKRRECSPAMQLLVGPMISFPVTVLCGLYTISNLESFSLKTNTNSPIFLRPGQQLQIDIEDRDGIWQQRVSKTLWKLTQRIKWTAKRRGSTVEVPHHFQHWEQELANVDRGCVHIPKPEEDCRMTYEGRTIQVYHEIIVFSYNKESNVLATSPQIPVIITPGYET